MPQKVPVLPFSMSAAVTSFPESCWVPVGFSTPAPLELLPVSVPGQRRCSLALRTQASKPWWKWTPPHRNERHPMLGKALGSCLLKFHQPLKEKVWLMAPLLVGFPPIPDINTLSCSEFTAILSHYKSPAEKPACSLLRLENTRSLPVPNRQGGKAFLGRACLWKLRLAPARRDPTLGHTHTHTHGSLLPLELVASCTTLAHLYFQEEIPSMPIHRS